MVFGLRIERQTHAAEQAMEEHVRNVAAFPLAIPLLAGPGAITATVLLAGQAGGRAVPLTVLIGVIVIVAAACLVTFLVAERIGKLLGHHRQCRAVAPARRASWPRSPCNTWSTASARCSQANFPIPPHA